jgi:elongation factor Ts
MAAITAQLVKDLREKTGAGMMDCKAALNETGGDMEQAIDWLRAKGLAKAAKKADRVAAEGLIGVAADGGRGAVVEVNSETDFVARNAEFQGLATTLAGLALQAAGDLDTLKAATYPGKQITVEEHIKELIATIGENMSLRRTAFLSVGKGVVAQYVHSAVVQGSPLGRIGVLVALESGADAEKLNEFGRQIAMHIAATSPLALVPEELDAAVVQRERDIFAEQARDSGKPEKVIEKMIEGRIRKFYEEVVLLKQTFVVDSEKTIEEAIKAAEKTLGASIVVKGFVRFALGEGIAKKEGDFAAEVAATAGQASK